MSLVAQLETVSAGGTQAVGSEAMLSVLPLPLCIATPTDLGKTSKRLFELLLDHDLNTEDMAVSSTMKHHRENSIVSFFLFCDREISVNLIMMQSWRRERRSASFIYKDIVPKERTAFICIISFVKKMLTKILRL